MNFDGASATTAEIIELIEDVGFEASLAVAPKRCQCVKCKPEDEITSERDVVLDVAPDKAPSAVVTAAADKAVFKINNMTCGSCVVSECVYVRVCMYKYVCVYVGVYSCVVS